MNHGYREFREVVRMPVLFVGRHLSSRRLPPVAEVRCVAASEIVLLGIEESAELYTTSRAS